MDFLSSFLHLWMWVLIKKGLNIFCWVSCSMSVIKVRRWLWEVTNETDVSGNNQPRVKAVEYLCKSSDGQGKKSVLISCLQVPPPPTFTVHIKSHKYWRFHTDSGKGSGDPMFTTDVATYGCVQPSRIGNPHLHPTLLDRILDDRIWEDIRW